MKEWICRSEWNGFTVGHVYRTDTRGYLIDDDGDERLKPREYNRAIKGMFEEVVSVTLENK